MCELWVCMSYSVTFSKRLSCGMSGECCPNIQNICCNTADYHSSWYYINLHLWHQATPVVKLFWLANQRWKCCWPPPSAMPSKMYTQKPSFNCRLEQLFMTDSVNIFQSLPSYFPVLFLFCFFLNAWDKSLSGSFVNKWWSGKINDFIYFM